MYTPAREVTAIVPRATPPAASTPPVNAELALYSDLDEPVVRIDEAGRLDFANDPARRLLGVPVGTEGTLTPLTVAAPWLAAALEAALATDGPSVVSVHDAEQQRWLNCRVHPLSSGTFVLIEDVTLRQLAESARQRVLKRTTISASPSDLAHEFNNVVMALIGNVELMATELSAHPELRESLTEVHAAAERALALGRQLVESMQHQPAQSASARRKAEPRTSRQNRRGKG